MRLKRIKIHNFGPHKDFDVELSCGLIGVIGPNGSGKSTLTDAAYAALTNDFSRFAGVKADNVRATADEDESAGVRVEIEHDGEDMVISRWLRPNRSEFHAGSTEMTKAVDIQAELEQRLGVTSRMLDAFVFVPQWQMFKFLSDTPAERAAAFQTLCGTTKARTICDRIADMLDRDRSLFAEADDDRPRLRARIAEIKRKGREARANLKQLQEKSIDEAEVEKLTKTIERYQKLVETNDEIKKLREEIETLSPTVSSWRNKHDELAAELNKLLAEKPAIDADANEAAIQLANREAQAKTYRRAEKLRQDLSDNREKLEKASAPTPPEGIDPDKRDDTLVAANQLSDEITQLDKRIDQAHGLGEVSTRVTLSVSQDHGYGVNTSRFTNKEEALADIGHKYDKLVSDLGDPDVAAGLEKKRDELKHRRDKLTAVVGEIDKYREQVSKHEAFCRRAQDAIDTAEASLREIGDVEPVDEAKTDKLRRAIEQRDAIADQIERKKDEANHADRNRAIASERLEEKQKRLDELVERVEGVSTTKDDAIKARKTLEEDRKLSGEIATVKGQIKELLSALKLAEQDMAEAQARVNRRAKAVAFAERLRTIRSDVLHPQKLPFAVAQHNLRAMRADINQVLETFGSPFWVDVSDDLTFEAHFPGEPPRNAARLSGGQKGVLAVAFRTAVSSLFGSEIGMMCLDEPTAGMDDRNVGYLADALTAYADQVRGRRQVILITHADELRSSFDQVIDLGANNEATEQGVES